MNETHDEYPSDKDLESIRVWPAADYAGLMDVVRGLWWMPEWGWSVDGAEFSLSTGGWSGNEELVAALQANQIFWLCCWYSSRRGGHYVFKLPSVGWR